MANPVLLKSEYQAESDLNTEAIAAYTAAFPTFLVGDNFTDTQGLNYVIDYIYAVRNSVVILARWINDAVATTDRWSTFFPTMMQQMYEVYSFVYPLATLLSPYNIVFTDAERFGEIILIEIDGFPQVDAVDYTWNPDTATLSMLVNTTLGQLLTFTYKKKPYYYGY